MRIINFAIATIVLVLLPIFVSAEVYKVEATGEYIMGDNDTKIVARRLAIEQAKRSATEQIGTYLESKTVVRNNQLQKDEIRTYASAILKTNIISENISLLADKTTVLTN